VVDCIEKIEIKSALGRESQFLDSEYSMFWSRKIFEDFEERVCRDGQTI
jgi:hypothetical protein